MRGTATPLGVGCFVCVLLLVTTSVRAQAPTSVAANVGGTFITQKAETPKTWQSDSRDDAETRLSHLTQIDETGKGPGLVGFYGLRSMRGVEAMSLVVDGVVSASWSIARAVDMHRDKRH